MVLPGDYSIKIKVGDKAYDSKMQLTAEENPGFTMEDRKVQYETAMQLYNMHEELAKTVDDISNKQKVLKADLDKAKSPKVKKLIQEYVDKLEELRGTLLPTKQKSIFVDEKRLREDISDVYQAVCNQEVRPSNLQIERINGLKDELKKSNDKNTALTTQYAEKIKAALVKEGLGDKKPKVDTKPGQ
jgi:hypothetical protein